MLTSKDIEIQADIPECVLDNIPKYVIDYIPDYRLMSTEVCLKRTMIKKKVNRLKNPLETMTQYKKRIFRICKEQNIYTDSVLFEKQTPDFRISGNRCGSVDTTGKKTMSFSNYGISFMKIQARNKILPRIPQKVHKRKEHSFF
ncbi:hypothetical protein SteCoe_25138 [Stentor coeruleus]|uniref:Uncharacterized protein n=1 Tax=Stentor coeruleus TaxID=5963 RepID=A0A1R2BG19_9CILI|nr:hypothetical protein SteCoe_25138 [Stentor coeruleus]